MRRYRHDSARAVPHEHEVRGEDGHRLAGNRMDCVDAEGMALLLHGLDLGLGDAALAAFLDEGGQPGIGLRRLPSQRVLGGDGHVGHSHDRVRARGVDAQLLLGALDAELHVDALGAADPVALHGAHLLRPAIEPVDGVEQLLGIVGGAHEPLLDLALLDQRAGAPPPAVDHLLVGQHRLVHRVPVDRRRGAIGQPLLHQPGEQPLLPSVVVRVAGSQLPVPVVAEAQLLELVLHVRHVGLGPPGRRYPMLDGRVLGRQPEGVPPHGLEHVLAQHPLVAGDHVPDGVVTHMPHVQTPGGVGKHGQAVKLLPRRVFHRLEGLVLFPIGLGRCLDLARVIVVLHLYRRVNESASHVHVGRTKGYRSLARGCDRCAILVAVIEPQRR